MEGIQMNEFTFADISVGQEGKFAYTVTQEKQDLFTTLTGDINPMHIDSEYATKTLSSTRGGGTCVWYAHSLAFFYTCWGISSWKILPFTTCGNDIYQTSFYRRHPDYKRKSYRKG